MDVPEAPVLSAFGLHEKLVPLAGGEGRSVRVGDAVLKPVGDDPDAAAWIADVMDSVAENGFRVARPLRTADGAWSCDGWTASSYVAGAEPEHDTSPRWLDIISAGRAFHAAIARIAPPAFLERRSDPWAIGDRVAWKEMQIEVVTELSEAHSLLTSMLDQRLDTPSQMIHGDLTGNVLFADGQDPAIIDFSPYWRPASFGDGIVVADAMLWHDADLDLLAQATPGDTMGFAQYVIRALILRLVVTSEFSRSNVRGDDAHVVAEAARYERVGRLLAEY